MVQTIDRTKWTQHVARAALVFDDGRAQARLVYHSVMVTMNWFPVVVFDSRPKFSIATSFKGMLGKKVSSRASLEASSVHGASKPFLDCLVDFSGPMWPVELIYYTFIHVKRAEVPASFE